MYNAPKNSTVPGGSSAEQQIQVLHLGKFYPPHHGGMETHLETLCLQLRGRVGLEVLVSNGSARTESDIVNGIPVTRLSSVATVASTPVNPALVGRIRASRADVVHLHWPNPSAALAYLMSGHTGQLVVSYHSDVIRQRFLGRVFEPVLQKLLRRSSAIVASSQNYVDSSPCLREHRERCHVIPLGIPETHFHKPSEEAVNTIRAQHGDRIILSVGRLVYYKGFDQLILAMADVPGRLLIAGTGPLLPDLLKLVRSLRLDDRVEFLGAPDDNHLRTLYHAADVFVLASTARSEAFGLVQVEAMAAGTPVVNTSVNSGVPFVSVHGTTGLTVPPYNSKALAEAIKSLLDDPHLRLEYGSAARSRAESMFRCSTMADRTLQMYQEVTGRSAVNLASAAYA